MEVSRAAGVLRLPAGHDSSYSRHRRSWTPYVAPRCRHREHLGTEFHREEDRLRPDHPSVDANQIDRLRGSSCSSWIFVFCVDLRVLHGFSCLQRRVTVKFPLKVWMRRLELPSPYVPRIERGPLLSSRIGPFALDREVDANTAAEGMCFELESGLFGQGQLNVAGVRLDFVTSAFGQTRLQVQVAVERPDVRALSRPSARCAHRRSRC